MNYLLDADWVISFLNGKPNAVELIGKLADEGIALSDITCGEVLEGLLTRPSAQRHVAEFQAFTETLDLIAPNLEVAQKYAGLRARLRSRGHLIPDNDLWLAATALTYNLTLVSRDSHFARVPELKLYQAG